MTSSPHTSIPSGVNTTFWKLLVAEPLRDAVVLDVGTGAGRVALAVAPLCKSVVGVDRESDVIEEARQRADAIGIRNVEFVVADADAIEFQSLVTERPRV